MKRIAIFPGSFDPVHIGHIHVIKKASQLFDQLIVAVSVNISKPETSLAQLRLDNLNQKLKQYHFKNVKTVIWNGYTVDLAKKAKAKYIIRGIRNVMDFNDELINASVNKELDNKIETVFFFSDEAYRNVASSSIKKIINKHEKYYQSNSSKSKK